MPRRRRVKEEAELNITSFMNLMIVLVPVLLLNMVFSHTAILDIKLPASSEPADPNDKENKTIELIVRSTHSTLNYPAGVFLRQFDVTETGEHDFKAISKTLQQLKQTLQANDIEKKDIVLLSEPSTDYQTIVSMMDTVRSYKAVVVTDVVNAELFPDVSLGDAPDLGGATGGEAAE